MLTSLQTIALMARIAALQKVQKRNPQNSPAWQEASAELAPLFAEMARRQRANGMETDWRKWKC